MLKAYTNMRGAAVRRLGRTMTAHVPELLWFEFLDADNISENKYLNTHSHTFFELHFVFSGTVIYQYMDQRVTLSENLAMLIPPRTPHQYAGFSGNVCKASLAFEPTEELLQNTEIRTFAFPESICEIADDILTASEKRTCLSAPIQIGRVYEILQKSFECLGIFVPEQIETEKDYRVAKAKGFIKKNLKNRITSSDVAKECCLSPKQLGRIFKEQTGLSVHAYMAQKRLDYCINLLRRGETSMKEIALLCGFADESGFASFFKRHCGTSPGKFREMRWVESPKIESDCP